MKRNMADKGYYNLTGEAEAVGYIRVSSDKQDIGKQRDIIKNWFRKEKIKNYRFIEVDAISSKENRERRKIQLLNSLKEGDMLVATEVSRLSRSTRELLDIVSDLLRRNVRIVFISQALDLRDLKNPLTKFALHMFAVFAEIERDRISQRTKEGLEIARERGIKLGKPRGIIQHSILDVHKPRIKEWCRIGFPYSCQARELGVSPTALIYYVRTRRIYRGGNLEKCV